LVQLKGATSNTRSKAATVFVAHFSELSYVHLQIGTRAEQTLEARLKFERYTRLCGVEIKHYHADNGRFAKTSWRNYIQRKGQGLSFCGVGAHTQNDNAEKRIIDIKYMTRVSLLHTSQRWPDAIDVRLWPYALRKPNESLNRTIYPGTTSPSTETFTGVRVMSDKEGKKPFGCPANVNL
jgi:hypothetical protein